MMIKIPVYFATFNSQKEDGTPIVDYIIRDADDNFLAKCLDVDVTKKIVEKLNEKENI